MTIKSDVTIAVGIVIATNAVLFGACAWGKARDAKKAKKAKAAVEEAYAKARTR